MKKNNLVICSVCNEGIAKKRCYIDFCSCQKAEELLARIERREIDCPLCKNTGYIWLSYCKCIHGQKESAYHCKQNCRRTGIHSIPGIETEFCYCLAATELLKKIEDGIVDCPLCFNSGIHQKFSNKTFCKCYHGNKLRNEVKADPRKCPFCKGKGEYPYGMGMSVFIEKCYH